ncbi:uncharacterized protein LOC135710660 [Ochlerotatus camptorhynchus]|uniref:uncharacterized protein LOC135710660 n=1 Tax=Ochlerotatus camptorhynchus TaxID=644619 RepID=UPI0031E2C0F1
MILNCVPVVLILVGSVRSGLTYPYADRYPYGTAVVSESKLLKGASSRGTSEGGKDLRNFNRDHVFDEGGKINSATDAVRYHALDNQVNGHRIADASQGVSQDKVKHLAGENYEADKSHNQKQVKSGFTNSYHKDESGSKSSFYEDSDDRGGKQVFDNRQNLRNNYNDHLYNKELRNDQLRDRYDDRFGGFDLRGVRDFHHQAAADRGNLHDYRDGFRDDRDHHVHNYGQEIYPGLPPMVPVRNYDELFQRRTFHEPRPMFKTAPHAPITVYEDPREYQYDYPAHSVGDRFLRRYDDDVAERTRIIFRPSPLLNYNRRY